jgi:hypothetical protein
MKNSRGQAHSASASTGSVQGSAQSSGQAMVESMIIILFVTALMFATVQMCAVVVNDLVANEAASAINRAVIVSSERTRSSNVSIKAALYVFLRQAAIKNLFFVPYDVETQARKVFESASGTKSDVYAYITYVKYASSIIFASYLKPSDSYTVGNIHLLKNTARAQTVHPSDEDYYYKAYPNAPDY